MKLVDVVLNGNEIVEIMEPKYTSINKHNNWLDNLTHKIIQERYKSNSICSVRNSIANIVHEPPEKIAMTVGTYIKILSEGIAIEPFTINKNNQIAFFIGYLFINTKNGIKVTKAPLEDLNEYITSIEKKILDLKGMCFSCSRFLELYSIECSSFDGDDPKKNIFFHCKNCRYDSSIWKVMNEIKNRTQELQERIDLRYKAKVNKSPNTSMRTIVLIEPAAKSSYERYPLKQEEWNGIDENNGRYHVIISGQMKKKLNYHQPQKGDLLVVRYRQGVWYVKEKPDAKEFCPKCKSILEIDKESPLMRYCPNKNCGEDGRTLYEVREDGSLFEIGDW